MNTISFNDLSGKVCVITGGAGVIGAAMVKAMASVGVKIAIADINKEVAERVAAEISKEYNAEVIGVEANVLDKESLIKAKAVINEKLGNIDMLINGAGGNHPTATTKVEQMDENSLDHLEDTVLRTGNGRFRQSICPQLQRGLCFHQWFSLPIC